VTSAAALATAIAKKDAIAENLMMTGRRRYVFRREMKTVPMLLQMDRSEEVGRMRITRGLYVGDHSTLTHRYIARLAALVS